MTYGPNIVAASAARTATGSSGAMPLVPSAHMEGDGTLTLGLVTTAVSGTTPSMTLSVEWSFDGGVTFAPGDPVDAFTAQTATGNLAKRFAVKGNAYRVTWTISGTTPSFTFSVTEVQY